MLSEEQVYPMHSVMEDIRYQSGDTRRRATFLSPVILRPGDVVQVDYEEETGKPLVLFVNTIPHPTV